jgi:hypothetical protein
MTLRPHWEIVTTDGIFLAVRYTVDAAQRAIDEFANRWPQGVIMVLVGK